MKWAVRGVAGSLLGGLIVLTIKVAPTSGGVHVPLPVESAGAAELPSVATTPPWSPPAWFPPDADLEAVAQMDHPGPRKGPPVRSRAAFVFDADSGEVLFERNADEVRPVASITKLISALTLASTGAPLESRFCVDARQYPSRSGAPSRLSTGDCISGWDALGAALVSSDNRAAYGLATVADLDLDEFVAQMNVVSEDLGMSRSSWADPSGLEDENLSTARDIARAVFAVAIHPVLAPVASAPYWDLLRENGAGVRRVFSTDRLIGREDLLVEAAKTGYTDTARYCFTTTLRTPSGRRLVIALLGAEGKMTRWADVNRIVSWVEAGSAVTPG